MELSIIIPVYNEEKRLPLTLEKIFEYLNIHYRGVYEVIIADDGSTDCTAKIVQEFQQRNPQLRLLQFPINRGRGAAVRDAVFEARGQFILETDGDGSTNEHAIIHFLDYFAKHPTVDMLIGSRTVEGARILTPQPLLRVMLGNCFLFVAHVLFGWKMIDRVNGFKMFRREVALDIFSNQYENGFLAEGEIVFVAEKRGWEIKELPILWTDYRGSRVNPFRESWRSFVGVFTILFRHQKGLYTKKIIAPPKVAPLIEKVRQYKTVLVTGGAGFIGSNFIRYFYTHHPQTKIVNLDQLTYAGNLANLEDIEQLEARVPANQQRYKFIQGDICDEELLERVFSEYQFDLVVHFAAESHVDRSISNAMSFVRTNIEGTRALVEASRRHNVSRFVNISTDEIYGSIKKGYSTEDWPLRPSNPYSASKAGADLLVQSYIRTHNFPAFIVRGSNNYGPYQYPEKLIPLAITNIIDNKKIPVHGYGIHVRSWLHVEDFCASIDLIAHGQPKHHIYNVAGEEKTNYEILELIARALGKNLHEFRTHVNDRPGADLRYAVDASRLEKEFGCARQHHRIEDEISRVVKWYSDHENWWRDIKLKEGFINHYEKQSKGQWV